jgi:hypothetical protein
MKIAVCADEVVTYIELEHELEKEKSKSQQLLMGKAAYHELTITPGGGYSSTILLN